MTQILHRKKIREILEDKICQQLRTTSKKVVEILHDEKGDHVE